MGRRESDLLALPHRHDFHHPHSVVQHLLVWKIQLRHLLPHFAKHLTVSHLSHQHCKKFHHKNPIHCYCFDWTLFIHDLRHFLLLCSHLFHAVLTWISHLAVCQVLVHLQRWKIVESWWRFLGFLSHSLQHCSHHHVSAHNQHDRLHRCTQIGDQGRHLIYPPPQKKKKKKKILNIYVKNTN